MTDTDFLAAALEDGLWHSHSEILNRSLSLRGCGLTVHSRAADLRKRGHVVEVDLRRDDRGRTLSFYRLALGETSASPDSVRDGTDASTEASPSAPSNPAPASSDAPMDHDDPDGSRDGGVLELFACEVDESAGLRGAYSEDAA